MFDSILNIFKRKNKKGDETINKEKAKERLHLVLMQDRANVSADFLDLMKQEIIDVIKKYIDVDEEQIDVKLTNKLNGDGTTGAPALYANIPIKSIKKETRIISNKDAKDLKEKSAENNAENSEENSEEDNNNTTELTEEIKQDVEKEAVNAESIEINEENNIEEINEDNTKIEDNNDEIEDNQENDNIENNSKMEENTINKKSGNNNEKEAEKKNKPEKKNSKKTTFFENILVNEKKDNKTEE